MATDLITARPCHPVLPAHFRLAIRARKSGKCASYVCAPANTAIDIGLWPVRVAHAVARGTPVPAAVRSRKQRCWVRKVQRRARVVAIRQHRELRMRRGQRRQIGSVPPRRPGLGTLQVRHAHTQQGKCASHICRVCTCNACAVGVLRHRESRTVVVIPGEEGQSARAELRYRGLVDPRAIANNLRPRQGECLRVVIREEYTVPTGATWICWRPGDDRPAARDDSSGVELNGSPRSGHERVGEPCAGVRDFFRPREGCTCVV